MIRGPSKRVRCTQCNSSIFRTRQALWRRPCRAQRGQALPAHAWRRQPRDVFLTSMWKPVLASAIDKMLGGAREEAQASLADRGEIPRVDPSVLIFTEDQVLGSWLPRS